MRKRPTQAGFTLTELLVVIAIIVVMCALLFPAYSSIHNSLLRMQCVGNMQQIYLAFQAYANDNNGQIVPLRETSPAYFEYNEGGPGTPWGTDWASILVQKSYIGNYADDYLGQNFSIFHCPVVQPDMTVPGEVRGIYPLDGTMGMNFYASTVYYTPGVPADPTHRYYRQIPNPSNKILFGDAPNYIIFPEPAENYPPAYRHAGKANFCFMDGHVESIQSGTLPTTAVAPW